MSEYTPTTEEVRARHAARDTAGFDAGAAAFDRWLAAHDAQKRAEWETEGLAEQGETVEWEYGSAVREANGAIWDHEYFSSEPITAAQLAEWNEEHRADGWVGSTIVAVRRSRPRVAIWLPVDKTMDSISYGAETQERERGKVSMKTKSIEEFWTEELGQDVEIISRGWVYSPQDYALYIGGTFMVAYKHLDEIEDWLARYFMVKEN